MLWRHITGRILSSFAIILAVLTLALTAMQFVRLGPLFLGPWVRASDLACLVALVPVLSLGIPASLALAASLVSSSMSARGERQAVAGAGVPVTRVVAAPLVIAAAGALVSAVLSIHTVPRSFSILADSLSSLATRAAFASLPVGRFFDLPGGGVLFASGREDGEAGLRLRDVILGLEVDGRSLVVTSPEATVAHSGGGETTFSLERASMRIGAQDGSVLVEAGSLALDLDLGAIIRSRSDELPAVLASPTSSLLAGVHGRPGEYHLHRRLALPVASLAILLLAALFFALPRIRRTALPPAVVAAAIVAFHGLMRATEVAMGSDMLDPATAAWLPAIAMAAVTLLALVLVLTASRPGPVSPARATSPSPR